MFFKDLKGDVKQEIWENIGYMNIGINMGYFNDGRIISGKIFVVCFGLSRDELG